MTMVDAITDQRLFGMGAELAGFADGWFDEGAVTFETGANAGRTIEVKSWTQATRTLELWRRSVCPPRPMTSSGSTPAATSACSRTAERFRIPGSLRFGTGNVRNFRGASGALVGSSLFNSTVGPTVEGPRLGDLSVAASTYGGVIPIGLWVQKVAGTMISATDIEEEKRSRTVGDGSAAARPSSSIATSRTSRSPSARAPRSTCCASGPVRSSCSTAAIRWAGRRPATRRSRPWSVVSPEMV